MAFFRLQDGNVQFARVLFSLVCQYFRLLSESLAKASATANLLVTKVLNKITYRPSLTEGNLKENLCCGILLTPLLLICLNQRSGVNL